MAKSGMDLEQLNFLKDNRKYIRTKITRKCNVLRDNIAVLSLEEKALEIEELDLLSSKLNKVDDQISGGIWQHISDRSILDQELETVDRYAVDIAAVRRLLQTQPISNELNNFPSNAIKLPQLPLPEYGHEKGESLERFFVNFETVVGKFAISDFEKFVFLKKQLRNEALTLINSLQGSHQSYGEAKKLLHDAFESPEIQKFDAINRLTKIKLNGNDDPYEFVSEVRNVYHLFDTLQIDGKAIMQYFVWRAMPDELQNQLIMITNSSRPGIDQIQQCIFEAIDRYKTISSRSRTMHRESVAGFAAEVSINRTEQKPCDKLSSGFRGCCLCSVSDHYTSKCPNYVTAVAKLNRLKSLKLCTRCMRDSHFANHCTFKFKRGCYHCKRENHFSFLCTQTSIGKISNQNYQRDKVDNSADEIVSGVTVLESNAILKDYSDNVLLPTFTCNLEGGISLRCLKDSGAQSSFVTSSFASKHKLRTLRKNINLSINGFNSTAGYLTRLVELNLVINNKTSKIAAICIPEVRTKLKLPGLNELANEFLKRGYKLADQQLAGNCDTIDDIDFIMGADCAFLLSETPVCFGGSCLYYETNLGVMLMGRLDYISSRLSQLPPAKEINVNLSVSEAGQTDKCQKESSSVSGAESSRVENQTAKLKQTERGCWNKVHLPYQENKTIPVTFHNTSLISLVDGDFSGDVTVTTNVNFCVIDEYDRVDNVQLQRATKDLLNKVPYDILEEKCAAVFDRVEIGEESDIVNSAIVQRTIDSVERTDSGNLIMPILWNEKTCHLLGSNFGLAKKILLSNLNKMNKNAELIKMVDSVFVEQQNLGIISNVGHPEEFLRDCPNASFLAHMPVFKMNNDTTKCRVVFLANLCEKIGNKFTVSHNQAILPGPCLNKKIGTSFLNLRFDENLLTFDIVKAFLQIELFPSDKQKLCFLWFKNVSEGDFSLVTYRPNRLPFGLPCSPSLLMLGLFKLLIVDADKDSQYLCNLKRSIYHKMYMDNGAVSANSSESLIEKFSCLRDIFESYCFPLQKFVTNDPEVRKAIETITNEQQPKVVGLLGLKWDTVSDEIFTAKLSLDGTADTKRKILSSIAKNFDLYNFNGPILNRARLFLHELQCNAELQWDDVLPERDLRNWCNIAAQVNRAEIIKLPRFIGRSQDSYKLIACVDSSKQICGAVLYLYNETSGERSFLFARNRFVGSKLATKSIPSLELAAAALGVELLIDTFRELTGDSTLEKVRITELKLYSDSLVSLSWIRSYSVKFAKINKLTVFVRNKLHRINSLCAEHSVSFHFCSGHLNPADFITRPVSYNQLTKSNFFEGISGEVLSEKDSESFVVPAEVSLLESTTAVLSTLQDSVSDGCTESLIDFSRHGSFQRIMNVSKHVLNFVNRVKSKLYYREPIKYEKFKQFPEHELSDRALKFVVRSDQKIHYSEVLDYFNLPIKKVTELPAVIGQLNVFMDTEGILRVKAKFKRWKDDFSSFPVLLSKKSDLAYKLIREAHEKLNHANVYQVIAEVRRSYWIPNMFSSVKYCIRRCIHCRRFNNKPIRLNQSPYRDFRLEPPNIPFRYLFLDYCGPFHVKMKDEKIKVYLLIFSCLWSRGVNIQICADLTVVGFLRAFQLHVYQFGLPELVLSDMGSQIVCGAKMITNWLTDSETLSYLSSRKVKLIDFQQYAKGCNKLGGLVESMVKLVKRILFGAVGNLILDYFQFEFLVCQAVHLVNRRPVAFRESLRENSMDFVIPDPITPEILLHGYELASVNVIPHLQHRDFQDPDWTTDSDFHETIRKNSEKLQKARQSLIKLYHEEFLTTLMSQAVSMKNRYAKVSHHKLSIGDLVLIREPLLKPTNYPMAVVMEVTENELGEVTSVKLKKGETGEFTIRHSSSLIPLLSRCEYEKQSFQGVQTSSGVDGGTFCGDSKSTKRPKRNAAIACKARMSEIIRDSFADD